MGLIGLVACAPDSGKSTPAAKVTMVGDSITYIVAGKDYRAKISQFLGVNFMGQFTDGAGYKHEGVSGITTLGILERVSTINTESNVYYLAAGVNDIDNLASTEQEVFERLRNLVDLLKAKNDSAKVVVSTVLPHCLDMHKTTGVYPNNTIIYLNTLIKNYYTSDPRVTVFDAHKLFIDRGYFCHYFVDGIHPNSAGYDLLAEPLALTLKEVLY